MNRGLAKSSQVREEVVKVDKNTAVRYRVVEDIIDLNALRTELEDLEYELTREQPEDETLLEWAKENHPACLIDKPHVQKQIDVIKAILNDNV